MTSCFDSDYRGLRCEDAIEEYRRLETLARLRPTSTVECKGCFLIVPGPHTGACRDCGAHVCLDCCALGDHENAFCYSCSQLWAEETEWLEEKEMWEEWNLRFQPVMAELLATVRCV